MPLRTGSAALVLALGALMSTDARAQDSQITGTITMHGCEAVASDFVLNAEPAAEGRGVLNATVEPVAGNRQQFTFSIAPVPVGTTHVLNLHFNPHCGPVFFHGPAHGLVMAGEIVPIDGYAARTRIEVLGEPNRLGRFDRKWLGADAFNFTDPAASVRKLRVQTDLANVSKFLVQFATEPFPLRGPEAIRACLDDGPSVVRTLEFNAVTAPPELTRINPNTKEEAWTELPPIDFNALLLGTAHPSLVGTVASIDRGRLRMLQAGGPLYVRAIPETVAATGALVRRCDPDADGIPGWSMLAQLLQALDGTSVVDPPFPLRLYSAEYVGPTIQPWPAPKDTMCLRAIDDHPLEMNRIAGCIYPFAGVCSDKWGAQFVKYKPFYAIGTTVPKGAHVCIPRDSSDGNFFSNALEAWGEGLTGFVDYVGGLVTDAGRLWKAIQAKVVEITADVINTVGVPCGSECEAALAVGLSVALTSVGVPPELPNLEALKGDLREYVAAEIANQVAPDVPGSQVLAEKALAYAERSIEDYVTSGSGANDSGIPAWVTPDIGLEPAVLRLTLEHVQSAQPPPLELLPDETSLMIDRNAVFERTWIDVPRRFFTQPIFPPPPFRDRLKVPIVLRPNLVGVPPGETQKFCESAPTSEAVQKCLNQYAPSIAYWNKVNWIAKFDGSTCVPFAATWWQMFGPFPITPLGFISYLTTPVLTHATYSPELPTPAIVKFCTP